MSLFGIKKVSIHFFWFLFFTAMIVTSSIVVENNLSNQYIYDDTSFKWTYTPSAVDRTSYNVLFDQHSHTILKGGDLTLRQNILWHIANGFNAMVLTEHNSLANAQDRILLAEEFKSQIIVMQGMEFTTDRIHMCFLGIQNWSTPVPSNPTDAELQAVISEVHRQGGVVTVNHPVSSYNSRPTHPTRDQLLSWGVDYIELVNRFTFDNVSLNWINSTGFGEISGTDMHVPQNVNAWTLISASNLSQDAIMVELRAKRTTVFYDPIGSVDKSVAKINPDYQLLKPLILLGELFKTYESGNQLDWSGIGIFAIYLIGIFIVAEILRFSNQKFWEKRSKLQKK
jgi:predicted metal-dependent phosphoesterase TrpH